MRLNWRSELVLACTMIRLLSERLRDFRIKLVDSCKRVCKKELRRSAGNPLRSQYAPVHIQILVMPTC